MLASCIWSESCACKDAETVMTTAAAKTNRGRRYRLRYAFIGGLPQRVSCEGDLAAVAAATDPWPFSRMFLLQY